MTNTEAINYLYTKFEDMIVYGADPFEDPDEIAAFKQLFILAANADTTIGRLNATIDNLNEKIHTDEINGIDTTFYERSKSFAEQIIKSLTEVN